MKKLFVSIFTIVVVLVADLVTKHFLSAIEYHNLIPGVISIATNHGNTGAAFGIFSGKTLTLIIVSVLMIAALIVFNCFVKNKNTFYCIAFGFVIGGALGNLVDRVFLRYVRDFIYLDFFPSFPVFNLADSFLCVGAVMLAIFILFMQTKPEKATKSASGQAGVQPSDQLAEPTNLTGDKTSENVGKEPNRKEEKSESTSPNKTNKKPHKKG